MPPMRKPAWVLPPPRDLAGAPGALETVPGAGPPVRSSCRARGMQGR